MQSWPEFLWLVRHGESAGNVARDYAERHELPIIDVDARDVDIPLSPRGLEQSQALGEWLGTLPGQARPTVVLTSPYLRARQTATAMVAACGFGDDLVHCVDERLREKEFGILNRYTRRGIVARFPQEAALRAALGKFYYRPPGGESWCDVILRLRSFCDHLQLRYRGERVLVVAHQVIVLCLRYVLEDLDEARILAIDAQGDVANCSITSFARATVDGRETMALDRYNFVAPLREAGAPVTHEQDPAVKK